MADLLAELRQRQQPAQQPLRQPVAQPVAPQSVDLLAESRKTAEQVDAEDDSLEITETLLSILEPALTAATGGGAAIAGGVAGLGDLILRQDPAKATQTIEGIQKALTFKPRSEAGQRGLQALGQLNQAISTAVQPVQQAIEPAVSQVGSTLGDLSGLTALRAVTSPEQREALGQTVTRTAPVAALELGGSRVGLGRGQAPTTGDLQQTFGTQELELQGGQVALQQAAQAIPSEAQFGELLPAQRITQTGAEGFVDTQAFLQTLPTTQKKAANALIKQDRAAADAVSNLLQEVGSGENQIGLSRRLSEVSDQAVKDAKTARRELSGFNTVFDDAPQINPTTAIDTIAELKSSAAKGGAAEKLLNKFEKRILAQEGDAQKLHEIKREIDIDVARLAGGPNANLTRVASTVDNALKQDIADQVAGFTEVNQRFIDQSPNVKLVEDLVGTFAKKESPRINQAVSNIFSDSANVDTIKATKKILTDQDPRLWNDVVRAELDRRLGKAANDLSDAGGLTRGNIPNQLANSIFGSGKKKALLFEALAPEQRKNFAALDDWLRRAGSGRATGSGTAGRTDLMQRIKEGPLGKILEAVTSPRQTIGDAQAVKRAEANISALGDVFLNPKFAEQMTKIRKQGALDPAAGVAMVELLRQAGMVDEVEDGNSP